MAFEEAGAEGLVPSVALERYYLNWDTVRQTLSQWEEKGKITCIEKRHVSNISRYILSKYIQKNTINSIK